MHFGIFHVFNQAKLTYSSYNVWDLSSLQKNSSNIMSELFLGMLLKRHQHNIIKDRINCK